MEQRGGKGGNITLEYERMELQEQKSPSFPAEPWRSFEFRIGASVQDVQQPTVGVLERQNTHDRGKEIIKETIYPELKGDLQIQKVHKINEKRPMFRHMVKSQNTKDLK